MSEENDHIDDTLKDLSLSPESLECHPSRIDRGWWGIYIVTFYSEFPCRTNKLIPEFNNNFF
jgi:hypothetical protein